MSGTGTVALRHAPVPGGPPPPGPALAVPAPPPPRARRTPWLAILSFVALVVLPLSVIATYYARHAADQFVATARFTVEEAGARPLAAEPGEDRPEDPALVAGERISPLTHVTASYLSSRALMADLRATIDLDARLARADRDVWERLAPGASAEAAYRNWRRRVRVAVDGPSGIVTLEVRAFSPEDAHRIAAAMLARTEALVNRLALRRKREALAAARAEAAESERRLDAAIARLAALRGREGLLDPAQEAEETLRVLAGLTAERIRVDSRLRVLDRLGTAEAAQARRLRTRRESLTADIAELRAQLADAGRADATLAAALARFEELEIRRRFAARLYGLAQSRAIAAEIDLARQSIFLNLFDPPQMPEEARYPRRVAFTLLAAAVLSVGWAILALIWASVADHRLDGRL